MTPKEKNDWVGGIILFAPMVVTPIMWFLLIGELNIGVAFLGPMLGIVCAKLALIFGVVT